MLAFFLLFFLTGFLIFIALLEGFSISHLKLGDIKYEGLYLKWNNRLSIHASFVDLSELHRDDEPLTLKPLSKITRSIDWMQRWVSSIDIQTVQYHNTRVSVHYRKNTLGTLDVHAGQQHLNGNFSLSPEILSLSLSTPSGSGAVFNGHLDLYLKQQKLNAAANLQLHNTPTLRAYAVGNQQNVRIDVKADQSFSSLDNLVDFLEVDSQTRPWITQYVKASRITLDKCHGSFLYDTPQKLFPSLMVQVHAENAQYTFAPALSPISAKKVDLLFKNGILAIFPHDGHFYTIPTEKSHLSIDFNTPHTQLNAHILTEHAQLNDSILKTLQYYDITVPIRQNSGLTRVDLKLGIDLDNYKTTAQGQFIPEKSDLQLEDFIFHTVGGIVSLDTTKVSFTGFKTNYKNRLQADVEGSYDAHTGKGSVSILPDSCIPTGDAKLVALSTQTDRTKAIYHIGPKQDTLQLLPSQWLVMGEKLNIEGFTVPFDFKNASAVIPKLHYFVTDNLEGTLSGKISPNTWSLQLGLDKVDTHNLLLRDNSCIITLTGDQNVINATSNTSSRWQLNGQNFSLSPLTVSLTGNKLAFDNIKVSLDALVEGSVLGEYLWETGEGSIVLNNMLPLNTELGSYVNLGQNQKFILNTQGDYVTLHSQTLGMDFSTMEQGWKITIPDLSHFSVNSPLLQQYQITHGAANLFYYPIQQRFNFNGVIDYPFKLMMVNGKSISSYRFSGSYQNGKSFIRVNDRVQIQYDQAITIRANNMGINAPELARWLDIYTAHKGAKEDASATPIHLNATNTFLYLMEKRKVVADTLTATLTKGELEARMTHAQGFADLQMKNGIYFVEGAHFNDLFMEHLFALSDFKGGAMSFKLTGKADDFAGIMRIENATLKEYKLLNNILSFINTIPSLATFSIPNYNTLGLPLKEAYSHYTFRDHLLKIDNFTLNSPELKMVGEGKMNFKEDSISGTLTLKSDLGSKLGRVPLVGYILFGNDGSVSTTVTIKGKLSDPVVETAIAKEIITAPFNILKRTITYPFLWMMDDEKKK